MPRSSATPRVGLAARGSRGGWAAPPERRAVPSTRRALGQLARDAGALRRAIAGAPHQREDRAARPGPGDAVDRAVAELEAALDRLAAIRL
jgi:hypothetical protein